MMHDVLLAAGWPSFMDSSEAVDEDGSIEEDQEIKGRGRRRRRGDAGSMAGGRGAAERRTTTD